MPGKKKGGNQGGNQKGGDDFQFSFGANGKPEISKETQEALMPVLQQRLDQLIGVDSGYLDTLPQSVQKRIKALKSLQTKHDSLEEQFQKEMEALEKKYDSLKNPLYTRRSEIVNGESEPTTEELAGDDKVEVKKEGVKEEPVKGIPDFWLTALKHHPEAEQMIQPHDEPILKHITDIKILFPRADSTETFSIEFAFSDNEFFDNKTLTKTFIIDSDGEGSTMLNNIEGTDINWKAGKNVTVKMTQKRQGGGGRGGKKGRGGKGGNAPAKIVNVEEPVESFFHIFDTVDIEEEFEDPEEAEEVLEQDYELGLMFRSQLVPDAVKWFTGEASAELAEYGDLEDGDEDDGEGSEDENPAPAKGNKGKAPKKTTAERLNEEYNSEDDDDYDPKTDPKAAAQPECKQQ